jgi:chromosome segregation ATPase
MRERVQSLEKEVKRLERGLNRLSLKLEKQGEVLKTLSREMGKRQKREEILMAALGLGPRSKVGDRGFLEDLDDSILRLEDYLLAMGERVQRILTMLQSHREFLDKVNESVLRMGQRERMRLELDIMMNSVSILAMAGIEIDPAIPSELEELRREVAEGSTELERLKRRKEELDRRLEAEIKRYDLSLLFSGKKNIPGYG